MSYENAIMVNCKKCNMSVDEEKVSTLNIEEDFEGRDVLTFLCPKCGTVQRSLRRG